MLVVGLLLHGLFYAATDGVLMAYAVPLVPEELRASGLAVVQTGTQVVFPNLDTVFHNVFSNSPKNSFDLGSYRSGDKPRSVIMTSPGLVEIARRGDPQI